MLELNPGLIGHETQIGGQRTESPVQAEDVVLKRIEVLRDLGEIPGLADRNGLPQMIVEARQQLDYASRSPSIR